MPLTETLFCAAIAAHGGGLLSTLRVLTGRREQDARDILQRTWECAWRRRDSFVGGGLKDVKPWLYGIARYEYLTYLRGQGQEQRLKEAYARQIEPQHETPKGSPLEGRALAPCMDRLKDVDRRILDLYYARRPSDLNPARTSTPGEKVGAPRPLTDPEIAEQLTLELADLWNPARVRKRRQLTLNQLRKCLQTRNVAGHDGSPYPGSLPMGTKATGPQPHKTYSLLEIENALIDDVWDAAVQQGEQRAEPLPPELEAHLRKISGASDLMEDLSQSKISGASDLVEGLSQNKISGASDLMEGLPQNNEGLDESTRAPRQETSPPGAVREMAGARSGWTVFQRLTDELRPDARHQFAARAIALAATLLLVIGGVRVMQQAWNDGPGRDPAGLQRGPQNTGNEGAPFRLVVEKPGDPQNAFASLEPVEAGRWRTRVPVNRRIQLRVARPEPPGETPWTVEGALVQRPRSGGSVPIEGAHWTVQGNVSDPDVFVGPVVQLNGLSQLGLVPGDAIEYTVSRGDKRLRLEIVLLDPDRPESQ